MKRLARSLLVVLGALIPLAGAWAQPGTTPASLRAEVERLRSYQARQSVGARILDGISRSLPELLWLDRLNVSPGRIVIVGQAFNTNAVATFVDNLDKLPDFDEPTLNSVDLQPDKTYKFTIGLHYGGGPAMKKASLEAERDALLRRLASRDETPEILKRLRSLFAQPGITVKTFTPLPLAGKGPREQVLPVEVRLKAASYQALSSLFHHLDRFLPIVALDQMTVARDDAEAGLLAIDLKLAVPVLETRVGPPGEAWKGEPAAPTASSRSPFQALKGGGAVRSGTPRPAGASGLRIADLELRATFQTPRGYVAQVRSREENKDYFVKTGDQLFDGEVVRIESGQAVLRRKGDAGEPREVVLSLKTQ